MGWADDQHYSAAGQPRKRCAGREVRGMNRTRESYNILLTDDDTGCREALREIVEPQGFRTMPASSGEEAADLVREGPVHLALLYMHLPRMTRLEALPLLH